jgi:hypothetical protein
LGKRGDSVGVGVGVSTKPNRLLQTEDAGPITLASYLRDHNKSILFPKIPFISVKYTLIRDEMFQSSDDKI